MWVSRGLRFKRWLQLGVLAVGPLAACTAPPQQAGDAAPASERPSRGSADLGVVFVLVDALRADALSCYGGTRVETPHLDALAARGVRFTSAFSNANWTLPSTVSLFTSTLPPVHRISKSPGKGDREGQLALIPNEYVMVPEVLREHDFRTAILTMSAWISAEGRYDQGVEELIRLKSDGAIVDQAEELLRRFGNERFFLYLHFKELHNYYEVDRLFPPEANLDAVSPGLLDLRQFEKAPSRVTRGLSQLVEEGRFTPGDLALLRASYDREVARTDATMGRLVAVLDRLGLRDRTLLVVTADHGERFLEHGNLTHAGSDFHHEVLHIPLILAGPDSVVEPAVIDRPVSTLDIMPTLLKLLDVPVPGQFQGSNLLGPTAPDDDAVVATDGRVWKLITQDWSYIRERRGEEELYDRRTDPIEQHELSAERPDVVELLRRQLAGQRERLLAHEYLALGPPGEVPMEKGTREGLRALGYID